MRRFYESFALVAQRRGWLRIRALKIDGVLKAVLFGYAYDGVFSALQGGRDPDDPHGVGDVLYNFELKACIEEGLHEYDFLGGLTLYKRHWGAQVRKGCDMLVGKTASATWRAQRSQLDERLSFCQNSQGVPRLELRVTRWMKVEHPISFEDNHRNVQFILHSINRIAN